MKLAPPSPRLTCNSFGVLQGNWKQISKLCVPSRTPTQVCVCVVVVVVVVVGGGAGEGGRAHARARPRVGRAAPAAAAMKHPIGEDNAATKTKNSVSPGEMLE